MPRKDEMVYHLQKRWRLRFRRDPDAGRVLFMGPLVVSFDVVSRPPSRQTPKRSVERLRCWWFGHEQHPQDSAPPDEATCMHCGEYVPYSDMVGDTRHNRAIDTLQRAWWHIFGRWLPHKCPSCGERFKCKADCDGIPF